MRTKTLLLAAVLSAAGAATSLAQAVYSVNAVGYVNKALVPGFQMIANPLDNKSAGGNTVSNLFTTVPEGTTIYKFAAPGGFSANGFEFGEWANPTQTLNPGEGAFIFIPGTANVTVTFVGEVKQGTALTTPIPQGFSIAASQVPQAGLIQTDLGYVPEDGDTVYQFNTTSKSYVTLGFEFGEWSQQPTLAIGESVFIKSPSAKSWVRNFSVNTP
jgi:hypothetical protein